MDWLWLGRWAWQRQRHQVLSSHPAPNQSLVAYFLTQQEKQSGGLCWGLVVGGLGCVTGGLEGDLVLTQAATITRPLHCFALGTCPKSPGRRSAWKCSFFVTDRQRDTYLLYMEVLIFCDRRSQLTSNLALTQSEKVLIFRDTQTLFCHWRGFPTDLLDAYMCEESKPTICNNIWLSFARL